MARAPGVDIGRLHLRLPGSGEDGRGVASRLGPLLGERLAASPSQIGNLRLDSLRLRVPQPPGGGEAAVADAVADAIAGVLHGRNHA